MLVTIIVILLVLLLGIGILLVVLTPRLREAQVLQQRLETWAEGQKDEDLDPILHSSFSDLPWLDELLKKMPWVFRLDRLRQQAGSATPIGTWLFLSITLGFLLGALGYAIVHLPFLLALGLCGLGTFVPFLYLSHLRKKRTQMFQEQLPEALDMLTRTIQAGHALVMGMKLVGEEFSDPLGPEFKRTVEQVSRWGIPFPEAMKSMSQRIDSLDLKYFVIALIIQREAGGALTEILSSLSNLIRKRFELQDRVRALSAEGKISAVILFALPILLALAMSVINPSYIGLLITHDTGQTMAIFGLTLMGLGGLVIKKMISLKV